jgi:hypothetical protein
MSDTTRSDTSMTARSPRPRRLRPRNLIRPAVAVVIAGVAAATLSGAAAAADSATTTQPVTHAPHVLHFAVEFSLPNVVDVPPLHQYQPGDYVTFGDVLRNDRGTQVGTEAGSGMITRIDSSGIQVYFSMAVQLAGGQIAAQGIASNAPAKNLVIVGGNGKYLGARGDLELVENGDGTGKLTLILR